MALKYAILITVVVTLVWAWSRFVKRPEDDSNTDGFDPSQFTISTTSQSAARAAKVLPTEGSEDVSSVLGTLEEPEPETESAPEDLRDYLPNEQVSWVVSIHWDAPRKLTARQIEGAFEDAWPDLDHRPFQYGQDTETGHWTHVQATHGPEFISDLKFEWAYYAAWRDEGLAGEEDFEHRVGLLRERLATLGEFSLETSLPPAEAARRAQELRAIHGRLDKEALIVLLAPEGETFDGEDIWDVMLCLGLTWGDMDVFHWVNDGDTGSDSHFAVWTSTPPGYFFPELIAAGKVHTEDLAFGFRIPRCYHTEAVYTGMYRAAEYAQQRLGGALVNIDGEPLDFDAELGKVRRTVEDLKAVGFEPGTGAVMQLF